MTEGNWQEASMGETQSAQTLNQLQPAANEADLTTDDLVFMIGEKDVHIKGKEKMVAYQVKIIHAMRAELSKALSIANDRQPLLDKIAALEKSCGGKDDYIKQLETDCHAVCIERDVLKKEIEELKEALKAKKKGK